MTRTITAVTAAALTATVGLAAASWVVAVRQMNGMDMGVATRLGSFASFVATWVPKMLPGVAPAVLRRADGSGCTRAVLLFVGSYLARLDTRRGRCVHVVSAAPVVRRLGAIAIAAGVYEFTPLKQHFRRCWRERLLWIPGRALE
jgi:hypothetical protein